jgi:SAM-dependent methyltransferase
MNASVEPSKWVQITGEDPEHSLRYAQRFRDMAAAGDDLAGEARMIDAMVARRSRILDAGCGPGRVAAFLAAAGHDVVGVDVDPVLIDAARKDHHGPHWVVADLAELDLPAHGIAGRFDAIVCAGNVMTFLAPSTRVMVLERLAAHLDANGRLVVGFGADRGYGFDEFLADAASAGLVVDTLFSSWDLRPWTDEATFLVAVLSGPAQR